MPDVNATNTQTQEEVVADVLKEIKTIGEDSKANYSELNKAHAELKKIVDTFGEKKEADAVLVEKYDKISTDIATRQNEIDKKLNSRVDAMEIAMKRHRGGVEAGSQEKKDAKDFQIACMSASPNGVSFDAIKTMEVDVQAYQNYKSAFDTFLRTKGDERQMTPGDFKSLSVGVDPDGGYTVTPEMSSRIVQRLFESDPVRQLAGSQSISTQALEMLVDDGQAGVGWEAETETGDETDTPQLNKKRIPVHVAYAKPRATQTLLEDSSINAETWLSDHISRRIGRQEAAAFVTGDGVGKPRGFLDYANGTGWGQIEQVAMGAAAALTVDGFISVKYSLIEEYLNRGTWLMNRSTVAAAMKLKDGEGRYIWSPGLATDETSTILGLPVRMSTTMPAVAAGALSVAIADWRDAYLIVDRLGITVQRDPYTAKPFVEFYTRKRVGGDVVNFRGIKLGVISA